MSRYLIVSHLMDEDDQLVAACLSLSHEDPDADFVLVVPTVALLFELLTEPQRSTSRFAAQRAQRARNRLLRSGINVVATRLGNFDPVRAVEDALRFSSYSAVVVAAPQHPTLRLLHRDLATILARRNPDLAIIDAGLERRRNVPAQQPG